MNKELSPIISAFKEIYYVVVGLAIINSVSKLIIHFSKPVTLEFANYNFMLILKIFVLEVLLAWPVLLLIAFLLTIIRFTLGGINALEKHQHEKGYCLFLFDLHFYIVTMVLFFVAGNYVDNLEAFIFYFRIILIWDILWIIFEIVSSGKDWEKRFSQISIWFLTDLAFLFPFLLSKNPIYILEGAVLLAIADYIYCKDEYWEK